MANILTRAGCFLAIIIMGWALRKVGFFQEKDFRLLSKIVIKITLPAAIVCSFSGKEVQMGMLVLSLLGLVFGVLYVCIGRLMSVKGSREQHAFHMLNISGYNIGNFTMPFVQSFLGPLGVIAVSLFDVGNALVCLGGTYSVASMELGGGRFSIKTILKTVIKSVAFDTYVIMTVLSLMHIRMPGFVNEFAGIVSNGNAFLAMLMLGVGFNISGDKTQLDTIFKILIVRYGIALLLALGCFFLLPLQLEYRQAVTLAVFAPISSASPAFTADLDGDFGLASAINSFSIVISLVCIVCVLLIVL